MQFGLGMKTKRKVKELTNMLLNRKVNIPGILIEVGFLSNPNERYLLQTDKYQEEIVKSLSEGITKYLKER